MEIKEFLKEQNKQIEVFYKKIQAAYFKAIISGKTEDYKELELRSLEYEKFFHNKETFQLVKDFQKQEDKTDEITSRQLHLLYNSYLGSQGDWEIIEELTKKTTEIERTFNTFQHKLNSKKYTRNDLKEILRKETNSKKLQQAWEALKEKGQVVEKQVLEVVKLRNKLAKQLGFDNYYLLSLEVGEQDIRELTSVFKELEDLTDKPFKELKKEIDKFLSDRYSIPISQLRPWHYQDPFFQEGPEIYKVELDEFYKKDVIEKAKEYYQSIGINVNEILAKSDLYEKPGKYPHACCMDMDRLGDTRIIQNAKNNDSWMETTLHELGHAIYNLHLDFSLPFLLRDAAHTFTTEAIAMLFGRKSKHPDFIKLHGDKKLPENISEDLHKMLRLRELVFSRWTQVMFHFEQQLYKNPDQDLNKLWWQLVKKYQLTDFSRDKPDWAAKIHLVSAPVYYHNYMLGELLASQLHHYVLKNIKPRNKDYSNSKETGEFLIKNIFKPSDRYRWDKMINLATGEDLTARYFVEEFTK